MNFMKYYILLKHYLRQFLWKLTNENKGGPKISLLRRLRQVRMTCQKGFKFWIIKMSNRERQENRELHRISIITGYKSV